jgi:hypothetical protein
VAAVQVRRRDAEADRTLVRERHAAVRAKVVPFVVHHEAARAPHYFFSIESLPKNLLPFVWDPSWASAASAASASVATAASAPWASRTFFVFFFYKKTPFWLFVFRFFSENRIPLGHIFGGKKYSSTKVS